MGLGGQSLLESTEAGARAICAGPALFTELKVGWWAQPSLPERRC